MGIQDEWIRITLRLPPDLRDSVADLAANESRSLNNQIVAMLARASHVPVAGYLIEEEAPPYETGLTLNSTQAELLASFMEAMQAEPMTMGSAYVSPHAKKPKKESGIKKTG